MNERLKRELMTLKPLKFRKGIGFIEDSQLIKGSEACQFLLQNIPGDKEVET
jgi:hypothetical protein